MAATTVVIPTRNHTRIIFSSTVMRASSNFNLHAEPFCVVKVVNIGLAENIFSTPNLQKRRDPEASKSCIVGVTMNIIRPFGKVY